MEKFDSLSGEDWRIVVDEQDMNEPSICYPDPDRRGALVGPLVTIHVGMTCEDDDGEEVIDLSEASGRNLVAVACLPQFADLLRWIRESQQKLNPVHFDRQHECGQFMQELRNRVKWIAGSIDDRDEMMGVGMHGFTRFPEQMKELK